MNKKTLSAIAAFLVALGALLGAILDDDTKPVPGPTKTVEAKVTQTEAKEIVSEAPPAGELQANPEVLRDETPEGVPAEKLEAGEQAAEELVNELDVAPAADPVPVAGAQGHSCRKDFQSRGVGAFRSHWVQFVWHFTVSANRPGWSDVYAIRDYLARVGLSATFIIDFEGHCLQTAPLNRNPQTQGPFNTSSVSVEIIATGKESRGQWMASPLIKDGILASLTRETLLGANLPLKFVDPVGCTPKAGPTDHDALECGNNHWDVGEQFPFSVVLGQMQAAPCGTRCRRVKELRGKHRTTHRKLVKNKCRTGNKSRPGKPRTNRYCEKLRNRNAAVHRAAKRERVSLKGTYR